MIPPPHFWLRLGFVYWQMIAVLRLAFRAGPFRVTSWWRDPRSNAAVGGDPDSQHLIGLAVDLVPFHPTDEPSLLAALAEGGFTVVRENTHIHVQIMKAREARESGLLGHFGV